VSEHGVEQGGGVAELGELENKTDHSNGAS
jgi:hypothetical protein